MQTDKTGTNVIRRFQITAIEAQQILSVVNPFGIYADQIERATGKELAETMLHNGYFRQNIWRERTWMRTEFVVVESIEGKRLERLREITHTDVSDDWWMLNILQQTEPAPPPPVQTTEDTAPRPPKVEALQAMAILRTLTMSIEEAEGLYALLTRLEDGAISAQEVQQMVDAAFVVELLNEGLLVLDTSLAEITSDHRALGHMAYSIPVGGQANIARFRSEPGHSKTKKSYMLRLLQGIERAKRRRDKDKLPSETMGSSPTTHKYRLTWRLRLTLEEARILLCTFGSRSTSINLEKESQLRRHLVECDYIRDSTSDDASVVNVALLNATSFDIVHEDTDFVMRMSIYTGTGATSRGWENRLTAAVEKATRRLSSQMLHRAEREFKLSLAEAEALLLLTSASPFTPSEMFEMVGNAMARLLYQHSYVGDVFGWTNMGKISSTKFVVSQEEPVSEERSTEIPQAEQADFNWYEHLRAQVEARRDTPNDPSDAPFYRLNLELGESQRLRYLFRVTGDSVTEVSTYLGEEFYQSLIDGGFLVLDERDDETVVRFNEDRFASTSISVRPPNDFDPERRWKKLVKTQPIRNHWRDRVRHLAQRCRGHMRKAGEIIPKHVNPASLVDRTTTEWFLVSPDEGTTLLELSTLKGLFLIEKKPEDHLPETLLEALREWGYIHSDGTLNIPLWQSTWFELTNNGATELSERAFDIQEGQEEVDGLWWATRLHEALALHAEEASPEEPPATHVEEAPEDEEDDTPLIPTISTQPIVEIIHTLVRVWEALRRNHTDVPEVVFMPASTQQRHRKRAADVYFSPLRWRVENGRLDPPRHEVGVTVECMGASAEELFACLLHEATHAMDYSRGINDCSKSQYHNRKFKAGAIELGLNVEQIKHYGFAKTSLSSEARSRYADQIRQLESVLLHQRDGTGRRAADVAARKKPPSKSSSRQLRATCGCGLIIRMSRTVIEANSIRCDSCGELFRIS